MAVVWIGLQLALAGQFRSDSSVRAAKTLFDLQTSAQLLGEEEPGVCSMHCPLAVVPAGTSAGHGDDGEQSGEQKSPFMPWICTFFSSGWHGPADGSP